MILPSMERVEFPRAFQTLLDATAESIISIGDQRVSEDFIHTITRKLPPHENQEFRNDTIIAGLALDTLLKYNPAAITRKDREAILDRLSDVFSRQSAADDGGDHSGDLVESGIDEANKDRLIGLMLRLLSTSNPTAKMACVPRLPAYSHCLLEIVHQC
jgi:hypothetical protein